jgi:hypothetical protein
MLKIRQGLTIKQSLKHPDLVSRFLQGNKILNLKEGHHILISLLGPSILEDNIVSGVFRTLFWVVWIHEEFQLDPLSHLRIRPIHLVILFYLGNKRNGEGGEFFSQKETKQWKAYSWPLFRLILAQLTCVITVLYAEK